jgi:pyruvate kinase
MLAALIKTGVNVFRLNFSHGTHEEHRETFDRIRAAAAGRHVAVLADLCGPKIRVGELADGQVTLTAGEKVAVTTREVVGHQGLIPTQYPALAGDVRPGDRILLDDGLLELRVTGIEGSEVSCTVVNGGVLKSRKGMNLPGVAVSAPALTDKDRDDAAFALGLGVDFLALSFVRRPWDVAELKKLIADAGHNTPVIAKIEKPEAMDCIDEILAEADGLMVARGDLGVEMPAEVVPLIQRDLVARARRACKPVIVATQMLESMVTNPRPTRAEVTDVSAAVFVGADAVMLSAETAAGAHPVEAVAIMDRVARQVEDAMSLEDGFRSLASADVADGKASEPVYRAAARATAQLSRDLGVRAVCVLTTHGDSAGIVSATRPSAPIVVLTREDALARRLALSWGVVTRVLPAEHLVDPRQAARAEARALGLASEGEYVLLLSGFGKGQPLVGVVRV